MVQIAKCSDTGGPDCGVLRMKRASTSDGGASAMIAERESRWAMGDGGSGGGESGTAGGRRLGTWGAAADDIVFDIAFDIVRARLSLRY